MRVRVLPIREKMELFEELEEIIKKLKEDFELTTLNKKKYIALCNLQFILEKYCANQIEEVVKEFKPLAIEEEQWEILFEQIEKNEKKVPKPLTL